MRNSIKYICTLAAVLISGGAAFGQGGQTVLPKDPQDGMVFTKNVTDNGNGTYTLTMEAFVTGYESNITTHVTTMKSQPMDAILVLDVSGSMDDNITWYGYQARPSQGYSHDDIWSGNRYWYLYNGEYYEVNDGDGGFLFWHEYYLYITVSGTRHYLVGSGLTTTRPTNFDDGDDVIFTGVLYERHTQGSMSKINALKEACNHFIDVVERKAIEDDVEHRIAIVKFAGDKTDQVGNQTYFDFPYFYNYTQKVLLPTSNYTAARNSINSLDAGGATSVDYGLQLAQSLLTDINNDPDRQDSQKLVIVYTDGVPTHDNDFSSTVASTAINVAGQLESAGARIYAIGTLTNPSSNTEKYMEYMSSNYPYATSMDNGGARVDNKYFQNTQNAEELDDVFNTIAEEETVTTQEATGEDLQFEPGQVTVNDIITPHFLIPDGLSSVKVYALQCTGAVKTQKAEVSYNAHPDILIDDNGHVWYGSYTWGTTESYPVPASDISITTDTEGNKSVSIENYDFSENWVGLTESIDRATNGTESISNAVPHGKKLVIEITIAPDPDDPGGQVFTNSDQSGIYYGGTLLFPVPDAVYTPKDINIHIIGLAEGETAIFKLTTSRHNGIIHIAITGTGTESTSNKSVAKVPVAEWDEDLQEYIPITYTIEELTDWTWDYNSSGVAQVSDNLLITNEFYFTVVKNSTNVKYDESMKHNTFTD